MWLKFAVILSLMSLVELRPQTNDNVSGEHYRASAVNTENNDSALLDNRYSGSTQINRINQLNNRNLSHFNDNLQNFSVDHFRNSRGLVFIVNKPEINKRNDKSFNSNNNFDEKDSAPRNVLFKSRPSQSNLVHIFKPNIISKINKSMHFGTSMNNNLQSSNMLTVRMKSDKYTNVNYQARKYIDVIPANSKLSSNVIQFWDTVPTGNPDNIRKEIARHNYDVKKLRFGNQTSTIITLAKKDKSKVNEKNVQVENGNSIGKSRNSSLFLKNWPDEDLQDNQDIDRYEKYTSLRVEDSAFNAMAKKKVSVNTHNKQIQNFSKAEPYPIYPLKWTKIPTVTLEKEPVTSYNPLYHDFEPNKPLILSTSQSDKNDAFTTALNHYFAQNESSIYADTVSTPISQVTQDTIIHIYNPPTSNKTNPTTNKHKINQIRPNQTPPKKVHILIAANKNESEYYKSQLNDTFNDDCPTITINTITKVNNTIQSKEGCTDLNIIINSHILNSNGEYESGSANDSKITSFEVVQGTHININTGSLGGGSVVGGGGAGGSGSLSTSNDAAGNDKFVVGNYTEANEFTSVSTDMSTNGTTDYYIYSSTDEDKDQIEAETPDELAADAESNAESQYEPQYEPPNNNVFTLSPSTTAVAVTEEEEEEEYEDYFSPTGIMEYFTSLFARYTYLNPINYGIFSMAVAPFAAFAAGVIGVATFLFPWAFPGAFDLARSNHYNSLDFARDINNLFIVSNNSCDPFTRWRKKCKHRKR